MPGYRRARDGVAQTDQDVGSAEPLETGERQPAVRVEFDTFLFEKAALERAAFSGQRDNPFRRDDAVPGKAVLLRHCPEHTHDEPRAARVAGHRCDLAIGRNLAFRNSPDDCRYPQRERGRRLCVHRGALAESYDAAVFIT